MKFLPALFVSMMLCATAFAASITDANFAAVNPSYPGADNWVRGSIYFQGKLVVRGEFHVLGHKAIANLGVWDGADWQPLGSGIKGSVSDFATNPATGNLVVLLQARVAWLSRTLRSGRARLGLRLHQGSPMP